MRRAHAGQGLSDRVVAQAADRRFAKGKLADYCRERGIPFESFEGLAQVHADLLTLVDMEGGPDPGPGTEGGMS